MSIRSRTGYPRYFSPKKGSNALFDAFKSLNVRFFSPSTISKRRPFREATPKRKNSAKKLRKEQKHWTKCGELQKILQRNSTIKRYFFIGLEPERSLNADFPARAKSGFPGPVLFEYRQGRFSPTDTSALLTSTGSVHAVQVAMDFPRLLLLYFNPVTFVDFHHYKIQFMIVFLNFLQ